MEPDEQLQSFPYDATIRGKEHHYRITEDEYRFGVEQDGIVIAVLENRDGFWKQVSGPDLENDLLESICDHIEAHYY